MVGAEALASGLRAVHGASAAFSAYLSSELGPILAVGLRPLIADGFALLGSAFAIALHERGWTIEAPVGSGARAMKNRHVIEPFNVLPRLVNDELSPQAWREQCVALDIVEWDLGPVGPAVSP